MKQQALLSGLGSLFSGFIYFAVDFPFPEIIAGIAFRAAACYFAYYFFFDLICVTCHESAGAALSVMGILALTLVVHFSGGIVSPFIFFYFTILILEALYGLRNPYTLPTALGGYLLVVAGQFSGFLENNNLWALEFYSSPTATFLMAGVTAFNIGLTRRLTRLIVNNLRTSLEQEAGEKEALLRKFSELNSTLQIGVLAHRIAHDLRGPIACISGYIQIEMTREKSPEDREVLKDLDETVTAMSESLFGITRFGKAGGPTSEKIVIKDFMRDLLAIATYSPLAKGVKFETVCPGTLKASVNASRADLQQAYFNIIKNAVEAVSDNTDEKKILIEIAQEGKDVKVSVSDNGPGISEDVLKTVFRKSITTKKEGTGVGLLITRDLLVRNSGEIKLHNRKEGGLAVVTCLTAA